MMTWRLLAPLLVLAGLRAPELSAQWPDRIAPGARVQVRLPEIQYQIAGRRGQFVRGRVTALSPDTLYMAVTDSVGALALPRRMIERLDLSRGVPSRGGSALRRGALTGALTTLTLLVVSGIGDDPGGWSDGESVLIGGAVGFASGALFGALYPAERWKRVRLDGR